MDNNLPKKPAESSGFAGQYPTDKPVTDTPPPPASTPASTTADASVTPSEMPPPFTTPVESKPSQPVESVPVAEAPAMSTTPVVDPFTPPQTVSPVVGAAQAGTPPPPPDANPFMVQGPATPPKKSSVPKLLIGLLILVALIGAGFLAFRLIGSFLTGNQPVTLTYWGLWENDQYVAPIIAEYKKTHPNVEIVYSKQNPRQYRERLQAAIERGDGPDIFRFHNTWVPMMVGDLAPAGSTGYSANEFAQTFYPVATTDLVVDGKVLGAPLMFDGLGLYYNEDLLRNAGVTPPTTWEEFRQAALDLTVTDETTGQIVTAGAALGTATNIEHFSDVLAVMMLQNGADLKNPATKEAQDALSFYRLFAEANPKKVWDETLDNSILAFASGKVAFMFAPSWQVMTIREANPELKFQIIPIPQLPGTSVTWASYWSEGVSSKSEYTDEAWEFLKFLTSKENMIALYTETTKDVSRPFGEPYSRIDLAQTIIDDPYVGAYIRQAQTAQTFFLASRTFDNGINDRMIKYLEDAVSSLGQGVSVEAALGTAASGFDQVLRSFGSPSAQ